MVDEKLRYRLTGETEVAYGGRTPGERLTFVVFMLVLLAILVF